MNNSENQTATNGTEGDAAASSDNDTKHGEQTQTANANTAIPEVSGNANIAPGQNDDNNNTVSWDDDPRKGDPRYFQTGQKQGQLRPSVATGGIDAAAASMSFAGLNTGDLQSSATRAQQREAEKAEQKQKQTKAKRKETEGKIAAGFIMQIHDLTCEYISDGTIGDNWNPEQIAERLSYREQVQEAYAEYMATLDVPLHPAVVLSGLSLRYMLPAFQTDKGASRVERMKAKIYSWWVNRRGTK